MVSHDFVELDAAFVRLRFGSQNKGQNYVNSPPVAPQALARAAWASAVKKRRKTAMRSDLVFGALSHVSNRYQLCQLASKATRKLHKPNTRLQDTTNDVLHRFRKTHPGTIVAAEAQNPQIEERRRAA
jgi:hypothetical protein